MTSGAISSPGAASRVRLLAVDDHADSAALLARMAERCGYTASATSDAREVGELVARLQPDVVAMDLCMPDTDGLELLKLLSETGFAGKVVIVSGQDPWLLRTAARFGEAHGVRIAAFIEKPVSAAALRRALSELGPER